MEKQRTISKLIRQVQLDNLNIRPKKVLAEGKYFNKTNLQVDRFVLRIILVIIILAVVAYVFKMVCG